MTQPELAEATGITVWWVSQLWRGSVVVARNEDLSSDEIKAQIGGQGVGG